MTVTSSPNSDRHIKTGASFKEPVFSTQLKNCSITGLQRIYGSDDEDEGDANEGDEGEGSDDEDDTDEDDTDEDDEHYEDALEELVGQGLAVLMHKSAIGGGFPVHSCCSWGWEQQAGLGGEV